MMLQPAGATPTKPSLDSPGRSSVTDSAPARQGRRQCGRQVLLPLRSPAGRCRRPCRGRVTRNVWVLEFAIEPPGQAARAAEADAFLERLDALASKKLARKYPQCPLRRHAGRLGRDHEGAAGWLALVRDTDVASAPFSDGSSEPHRRESSLTSTPLRRHAHVVLPSFAGRERHRSTQLRFGVGQYSQDPRARSSRIQRCSALLTVVGRTRSTDL